MSNELPDPNQPLKLQYFDSGRGWLLARRGWHVAVVILVLTGLVGGFLWSNALPEKAVDGGLSRLGVF